MPGVIVTSALVSFAWGYLLYTGDISSIWPMFGATNQTLAALALAIGTTIILRIGREEDLCPDHADPLRLRVTSRPLPPVS